MEYVEGRTVIKLVNSRGPFPEWLCRHVFCQLISALEYLHEDKKMVHRDLKVENIIVDKFGNIQCPKCCSIVNASYGYCQRCGKNFNFPIH